MNLQEMLVFIDFQGANESLQICSTIEVIVTTPLTSQITHLLWLLLLKLKGQDLLVNRNKGESLLCNKN